MICLDTHVVVWLYAGETSRLPARARDLIEAHELLISPMVLLEMQYLKELGRLKADPSAILAYLNQAIGLTICDLPFSRLVTEALGQTWTRDPFDRLITAGAAIRKAILLSMDATILAHYPEACWE